ncbi:hypothetical protein B0H10DRAFT_2249910 [Mycena sp. CBHHK59/15]|nr:hypothetical protein B0H10DRAFT_2249910 [Mycena sp. CBHHK59/15]
MFALPSIGADATLRLFAFPAFSSSGQVIRSPGLVDVPTQPRFRGLWQSPTQPHVTGLVDSQCGYASYETDDYGRPFGGDEGRFEEKDARAAPEEQKKPEMVLGRDEPSLEDVPSGPEVYVVDEQIVTLLVTLREELDNFCTNRDVRTDFDGQSITLASPYSQRNPTAWLEYQVSARELHFDLYYAKTDDNDFSMSEPAPAQPESPVKFNFFGRYSQQTASGNALTNELAEYFRVTRLRPL